MSNTRMIALQILLKILQKIHKNAWVVVLKCLCYLLCRGHYCPSTHWHAPRPRRPKPYCKPCKTRIDHCEQSLRPCEEENGKLLTYYCFFCDAFTNVARRVDDARRSVVTVGKITSHSDKTLIAAIFLCRRGLAPGAA